MNLIKFCNKCVYPSSAVNLNFNEDGICSSCQTFKSFELSNKEWSKRKIKLTQIIKKINKNNKSNYDCIIGVSGGKDSYYQTHVAIHELGLKPLLVTYNGNNFLEEGIYNRDRMKMIFNADHLIMGPSEDVLIKLNKLAFIKMGDMNWQNHCGIFTFPIQAAVAFKIPIILWGETPWDISGMHDANDFVEFSARTRHEHGLRGFEYNSFINNDKNYKLTEKDMLWAKYPSDQQILSVGVRGLYIGNFFPWDPNQHTKLIKKKYGWIEAKKPFQRTYRKSSNLDDRYENGIHDLMKFIKFGYGRCSDHSSKDIRTGYMSREKAKKLVLKMDHVVSNDLDYWLKYVGESKEWFWRHADRFRDHKVWWIKNNKWFKNNIDGTDRSYGEVYLNKQEVNKFNQKQEKYIKQLKKFI